MISTWRIPVEPLLSCAHGFDWTAVADVGARMLAIGDGDRAIADRAVDDFAERIWPGA